MFCWVYRRCWSTRTFLTVPPAPPPPPPQLANIIIISFEQKSDTSAITFIKKAISVIVSSQGKSQGVHKSMQDPLGTMPMSR